MKFPLGYYEALIIIVTAGAMALIFRARYMGRLECITARVEDAADNLDARVEEDRDSPLSELAGAVDRALAIRAADIYHLRGTMEELERADGALRAVIDKGLAVAGAGSPREALRLAEEALAEITGAAGAWVLLRDGGGLTRMSAAGEALHIPLNAPGIFARVARGGGAIFTNNVEYEAAYDAAADGFPGGPRRALLAVPVRWGDSTLAVAALGDKAQGFADEDMETAALFSRFLALALKGR